MSKTSEQIEIFLLLEAIYQKYGYDFREYSESHVYRRIKNRQLLSGIESISQMQYRVLYDEVFAAQCISDLSITVTEMFRDADFYLALRETVIPVLKTYPFIKVWHAGCATGEEVYSMAILLHEEGLYEKSVIYATDFNQNALNKAKEGIFSGRLIKEYTHNYQTSGGKSSFSDYYTSEDGSVILNRSLKKNIVWANHNLVTDSAFAEVNLLLCRNVFIYFNKSLQSRVLNLFSESLVNGGVLCLGSKESIELSDTGHYSVMNKKQSIYRKRYENRN